MNELKAAAEKLELVLQVADLKAQAKKDAARIAELEARLAELREGTKP
jgi:chaperonin cofactor prefoldin